MELCQTVRTMAEHNFIFLKYEGKGSAMAGCEKCQRKFLTTAVYSRDAVGAQDYLFSKLDRHDCEEKPKEASLGVVRLVTIAKPDCWAFFLAHLGACPPKHLSRILFRGTATQDSLLQLPRPWREIAEGLH